MSRIGKQTIELPNGVEARQEKETVIVKGPKGELKLALAFEMEMEINGNQLSLKLSKEAEKFSGLRKKKALSMWGTSRMLVYNMVKGVAQGFEKKLELQGIGFKAGIEGGKLAMSLGFSHPVVVEPPAGITFAVEKNIITISGIDKQLVGHTAAQIRKIKKPEPYKGKGIRYLGEIIKRKAGKKASSGAK